jgi:hypothetical protein
MLSMIKKLGALLLIAVVSFAADIFGPRICPWIDKVCAM